MDCRDATAIGANLISSLMPEEIDESQIRDMDTFLKVIVVRPTFAHNTVLISTSSLLGFFTCWAAY